MTVRRPRIRLSAVSRFYKVHPQTGRWIEFIGSGGVKARVVHAEPKRIYLIGHLPLPDARGHYCDNIMVPRAVIKGRWIYANAEEPVYDDTQTNL